MENASRNAAEQLAQLEAENCDLRSHVAEAREIEKELHASLREVADLKAALDEHAIVAITDPKGKILYVNDKFCAISKYSRAELLGRDHRIINSGHHSKDFIRNLWATISSGKVWKGEIKNKAKDGSYYWVDTTIMPFLTDDGVPRQYVAIRADITERKHAEEALRRSQEQLQIVVENLTEGLIVADLDGQLLHWNRASVKIHGFDSIEEGRRRLSEFSQIFELSTLEGRVLSVDSWPLNRILRGESLRDVELRIRRLDRDWSRIFTYSGSLIRQPSGQQLAMVGVNDITERKEAEEALHARDVAQAASRLKSGFIASMSHELRTPLNGIIGFSELMIDGRTGSLTDRQTEYITDIYNSGRHLLQLINDVLDLAKIEAGRMELHTESFYTRKAVEEVFSVVEHLARKKELAVSKQVDESIEVAVLDRQKLKQILFNLLSNAIKFTDSGGSVALTISLCDVNSMRIRVVDTGIGIKKEDIGKLFIEFQQLDSGLARRHQGTGLGLALTKRIVEFQGGTIEVESEFGVGSTFTVILPLLQESAA